MMRFISLFHAFSIPFSLTNTNLNNETEIKNWIVKKPAAQICLMVLFYFTCYFVKSYVQAYLVSNFTIGLIVAIAMKKSSWIGL